MLQCQFKKIIIAVEFVFGGEICRPAGEQISALGGRKGSQSVYVLALTATNVSGRILLGIGSDWVLVKFGVSR